MEINGLMHMFQQNSYKPREYREWLQVTGNIGRMLGKILYALISIPFIAAGSRGFLIAAVCMNIMTILVNKPRQAKKPLVYTARVKRMFTTTALLFVIAAAVSLVLPIRQIKFCALVLLVLFVLEPVLVLAVNFINHPIELAIDRHYINDAARILKEMPNRRDGIRQFKLRTDHVLYTVKALQMLRPDRCNDAVLRMYQITYFFKNLTVIGVTGSYGKTSVKYFLSKLLSTQFSVLHTPGNYNTTLKNEFLHGNTKCIGDRNRSRYVLHIMVSDQSCVKLMLRSVFILHFKHGAFPGNGYVICGIIYIFPASTIADDGFVRFPAADIFVIII